MAVAEHLLELEQLLAEVPPVDGGGVIQFRLDHPTDGRTFFSVSLGSDGHQLERRPRTHPTRSLAISGDFDDWMRLYQSPHAQRLGNLRLWGATKLLEKILAPRTKRRSFVDVRCRGGW